MPKSFKLKNQPEWLSRIISLITLIFAFSLLSIAASGLWVWFGIAIIVFIVILILLYGVYFFAETIEIILSK